MSNITSIRIEATEGEAILISASGVDDSGAQVYLFTESAFKQYKTELERDDRIRSMPITDMETLVPGRSEWAITIPSRGIWHIAYQPWQARRMTVHRSGKTP